MQPEKDKQTLITRLTLCVVLALMLCYGGEKVCDALKPSFWEKWRPWMEKNRIQAAAVTAAVLFGASLALFPLPPADEPGEGLPGDYEPCEP